MTVHPPLKNNRPVSKRGGARPGAGRKPGVPNKATAEIKDLARKYTAKALSALVEVMEQGESEAARVSAANAILDRGYGRPSNVVAGDSSAPIQIKIIREIVGAPD